MFTISVRGIGRRTETPLPLMKPDMPGARIRVFGSF